MQQMQRDAQFHRENAMVRDVVHKTNEFMSHYERARLNVQRSHTSTECHRQKQLLEQQTADQVRYVLLGARISSDRNPAYAVSPAIVDLLVFS